MLDGERAFYPMLPISYSNSDEEDEMREEKFRDDIERLQVLIENTAHCVYGLAKDDKSKSAAKAVASRLLTLSGVKFEKEEEPIRPRVPRGEEDQNV